MSKYFNDPREEKVIGPTYRWGAMIFDLNGLPVEEYMKPMTVIVSSGMTGGNTGETTTKETVKIVSKLIRTESGIYGIKFSWIGSFTTPFLAGAKVSVNGVDKVISQVIVDNDNKYVIIPIEGTTDSSSVNVISFLLAESNSENISEEGRQSLTILDITTNTQYTFKVTTDESELNLTLSFKIDNQLKYSVTLKFGDEIPEYSGSTEMEGREFIGWKDADGVEHTTMPPTNLILYAQYRILVEPTAYFVIASNSSLETESGVFIDIADEIGFKFTCNDDREEHIIVTADAIPTDPNFDAEAYSEDDGDNDYAREWNENHGYSFILYVPSTYDVYSMKHGNTSTTNFVGTDAEKKIGTTSKDGITYNVYAYCNRFHEVMQEETFDFTAYVILNKN